MHFSLNKPAAITDMDMTCQTKMKTNIQLEMRALHGKPEVYTWNLALLYICRMSVCTRTPWRKNNKTQEVEGNKRKQ